MTKQTIDATLFASSHPDIAKRTCISKLIFSLLMMLVGVFIFFSIFGMNDKTSTLSMALMVLGTALILMGVFCLFWKSKSIVYLPTGSAASERSLFFDLEHLNELTEIIKTGKPDENSKIKSKTSGNVRVDIMISRDNKFVAMQLFQYVPYAYTPITSVRYFTGEDATVMAAFLRKSRVA